MRFADADLNEIADSHGTRRLEHDNAVAAVASTPTRGVAEGRPFHEHLAYGSHEPVIACLSAHLLVREQHLVAPFLFLRQHVIGECR